MGVRLTDRWSGHNSLSRLSKHGSRCLDFRNEGLCPADSSVNTLTCPRAIKRSIGLIGKVTVSQCRSKRRQLWQFICIRRQWHTTAVQ